MKAGPDRSDQYYEYMHIQVDRLKIGIVRRKDKVAINSTLGNATMFLFTTSPRRPLSIADRAHCALCCLLYI